MDSFERVRDLVNELLDQHAQWADIQHEINAAGLEADAKDALWLIAWQRLTDAQRSRILRLPAQIT